MRYLLTKYKPKDLVTNTAAPKLTLGYRKESPRYYADVYIKSLDTFVEVKSTYYLLGAKSHGYPLFKANKKKAKYLHEQGIKLVWIVPSPDHSTLCQLPTGWWEWSAPKVLKYVQNNQRSVSILAEDRFQCRLLG